MSDAHDFAGTMALTLFGILILAITFVPAIRRAFLHLYIEPVLRAITRRRRPNYAEIRRMERELLSGQ